MSHCTRTETGEHFYSETGRHCLACCEPKERPTTYTTAHNLCIAEALSQGITSGTMDTVIGAFFRGAYRAADDAGFVSGAPIPDDAPANFADKLRTAFVQGYLSSCPRSLTIEPHGRVVKLHGARGTFGK